MIGVLLTKYHNEHKFLPLMFGIDLGSDILSRKRLANWIWRNGGHLGGLLRLRDDGVYNPGGDSRLWRLG